MTTWLSVWLVESFHKGRSHSHLHLTLHCAWAFLSSWQQDPRIDQPFPTRCTCRRVCGCHTLCGPSGMRHKRAVPCCCASSSIPPPPPPPLYLSFLVACKLVPLLCDLPKVPFCRTHMSGATLFFEEKKLRSGRIFSKFVCATFSL